MVTPDGHPRHLPAVKEPLEILEEHVVVLVDESVHLVRDLPRVVLDFEVLAELQSLVAQVNLLFATDCSTAPVQERLSRVLSRVRFEMPSERPRRRK